MSSPSGGPETCPTNWILGARSRMRSFRVPHAVDRCRRRSTGHQASAPWLKSDRLRLFLPRADRDRELERPGQDTAVGSKGLAESAEALEHYSRASHSPEASFLQIGSVPAAGRRSSRKSSASDARMPLSRGRLRSRALPNNNPRQLPARNALPCIFRTPDRKPQPCCTWDTPISCHSGDKSRGRPGVLTPRELKARDGGRCCGCAPHPGENL